MPEQVKAEAAAVRTLITATTTYAEALRAISESARRRVAATNAAQRETVDRHRSNVKGAAHDAQRAQEELVRCSSEQHEQYRRRAEEADRRAASARLLLDRARRAEEIGAEASSQLLRVLQQVDATIGQHSSAASAALGELTKMLEAMTTRSLTSSDRPSASRALSGLGHFAEGVATVAAVANFIGNSAPIGSKLNQSLGDRQTTQSEITDDRIESLQQQWAENKKIRLEREMDDIEGLGEDR